MNIKLKIISNTRYHGDEEACIVTVIGLNTQDANVDRQKNCWTRMKDNQKKKRKTYENIMNVKKKL